MTVTEVTAEKEWKPEQGGRKVGHVSGGHLDDRASAAISSTRRPVPAERRPMAFSFNLELADGTPADPSSFHTAAPQWKPGDTIPLGQGRALRVVGNRVTDVDETPVLIVEDASK
jgi:hypothetical protein